MSVLQSVEQKCSIKFEPNCSFMLSERGRRNGNNKHNAIL